jgi:hypothetical protein
MIIEKKIKSAKKEICFMYNDCIMACNRNISIANVLVNQIQEVAKEQERVLKKLIAKFEQFSDEIDRIVEYKEEK